MADIPPEAPPRAQTTLSSSPFSSNGSIVHLNIPISVKLNDFNYLTWKSQVLHLIIGYDLGKYISSAPLQPKVMTPTGEEVDNPVYPLWNRQDQLLLGWLRTSLSETALGQVVSCLTTYDLWQSLQQTYSGTSRARLTDLKRQLQTTTKGFLNCSDYIQKMKCIADELSFIESPVPTDDLVMAVLNGLGSDYHNFVLAITTKSEPVTLADLHAHLLTHENRINSVSQPNEVSLPSLANPSSLYTYSPVSNNAIPANPRPGNNRSGYNRAPRLQYRPGAILPTPN